MKKNTLLYLDADLVKIAKHRKINISKLTENAIKMQLFSLKQKKDLKEYLNNLKKEQRLFYLPNRIKKIEMEDIGPIKEFKHNLKNFNIIFGNNATGKTVLIRSLAKLFENSDLSITSKIKIYLKQKTTTILTPKHSNIECLLIDCGGINLKDKEYLEFIKYLKKLNLQIILTELDKRKNIDYRDINLIDLNV